MKSREYSDMRSSEIIALRTSIFLNVCENVFRRRDKLGRRLLGVQQSAAHGGR